LKFVLKKATFRSCPEAKTAILLAQNDRGFVTEEFWKTCQVLKNKHVVPTTGFILQKIEIRKKIYITFLALVRPPSNAPF